MRMFTTKTFRKWLWCSSVVLFTAVLVASPVCRVSAEEQMLVGRIAHVDGQLLRFVPAEKDWVATVKDAPFGMDDAVYSDQDGRAEFILPNNTRVRIGKSTQMQLIALKNDVTEVDVASGVARFYSKRSKALIKATTPFGYVVAQPESVFDLYVGDQSAEVITLSGKVDFVHAGDKARYEVVQGSSSLIADAGQVGSGDGAVDANWDDWNVERDGQWSRRVSVKGESVKYLPAEMHDEAYEFEENGKWETVNYEGKERHLWRPTRVGSGWAPFTAGRWTEYYGDNTWIPDEPFGYATHHYGNWVNVNNVWYWGPPATVGAGIGWYPGRVAWIGSGADVGWVPLAPQERYYSHHHWGPSATVIGTAAVVGLTIGGLSYLNHAVLVPQQDFYGVNNYSRVRVTNINRTTIINNYKSAPVVNTTVFKNYNTDRNRYNFTDAKVANKPHQTVLNRIERNQGRAKQEGAGVNANSVRQSITQTKQAALPTQTKVAPPKVTSKIVPINQVNKPASEVKFQPKDLKEKPKQVAMPKPGEAGQQPAAPGKGEPVVAPGKDAPVKPGEKARAGETKQPVDSAAPSKSPKDQVVKPGVAGQQPAAPGKGEPVVAPGKDAPVKPGEKVRAEETKQPVDSAAPSKSPRDQVVKPGVAGQQPVAPGKGSADKPREKVRPGETKQPVDSGGPPTSPKERLMKPGEAGSKAPGAGREPLKEQKHVTPPESSKPQMQGEARPGRQQPQKQGDAKEKQKQKGQEQKP